MFRRLDQGDLLLTSGPDAEVFRVSLRPFAFVSTIRWCDHRRELFATAVPAGRRVPDVSTNDRGELSLFRCDPRDGGWQRVYQGYAHDPVCLPDGGYVAHRGAGLTLLDVRGAVVRELKVGRFGWGPPALSVSPGGDTVAWLRWRGDDGRLRVEGVEPGRSAEFRTTAGRYAWLDPQTLVYVHGARPRLLDVASGATRRFGRGLHDHARRGVTGGTDELRALAELPARQLWESYDDLQVVGDDVWFSAALVQQRGPLRVDGIFRTDRGGNHLTLVAAMPPGDRVEGFFALPDRSALILVATHDGTAVVGRREAAVGPAAGFLASGWSPLLESSQPEFGFHRLPASAPQP
ncbi:hypothetical protein AB0J86_31585 [Micromonospora sp. NPDC049559]|uniref:hypothetical protein n=1 Tax=Micromonospora sp. NPDC049559 TaxID=3155923 RepID=UPI00341B3F1E